MMVKHIRSKQNTAFKTVLLKQTWAEVEPEQNFYS